MSHEMGLGPTPIIPTGLMTGTSVITSQYFNVIPFQSAAFAPVWTGTPTGLFIVEVSLDYVPNFQNPLVPINPGNWNNLGASVAGNPAGSPGSIYIPCYGHCSAYIRLKYTNSGGSGVLGGSFFGKLR